MEMEVAGGRRKPSGRDRLSNMPDCLLHGVLSHLRSRQAVQTCALSRRWTHLWRAAHCIHIDSAEFSNQERRHQEVSPRAKEEALAKLEDFADSLLLRRGLSASSSAEPPLDALRLHVHGGGPRGDANMGRWIRRGLKLSPAALDVSGGDGYPINLNSLSSSTVPGSGAGRLTRLRLDNVLFHRDFQDLLGSGGLPVLEDLEIRNAVLVSEFSRIESDTLTSLTIVDVSSHHQARASGCMSYLRIATPRLASLRLEFPIGRLASVHFKIEGARACLAQASIGVLDEIPHYHKPWRRQDGDGQQDDDEISNLCALLGSLSSVTSLHPSGFQETKQLLLHDLLDEPYSWSSMFPNLTSLVLEDCDLGDNLRTLWRFLPMTPTIKRLALNRCEWRQPSYGSWESDEEKDIHTMAIVPYLKLVRIIHGDTKIRSVVKKKLPCTTITK